MLAQHNTSSWSYVAYLVTIYNIDLMQWRSSIGKMPAIPGFVTSCIFLGYLFFLQCSEHFINVIHNIKSRIRDKVRKPADTKVNSFANYNPALHTKWVVVKKNKFKPYHEKELCIYVDGVGTCFLRMR
jgi:hypothetical protein